MRIVLIFTLIVAARIVVAQNYNVHEIGLPENSGSSQADLIHKDKDGFIWLAIGSKIYRYTGQQYSVFHNTEKLNSEDRITAIYQNVDEKFWLGWESGAVSFLKNDSNIFFMPEEGLPVVPIVAIAADQSGQLWFATYGEGVYVQTKSGRWYNISEDDGLPGLDTYDLLSWKDGVALATDQGLVFCSFIDDVKHVKVISIEQGLPDQIVKDLNIQDGALSAVHYEPYITLLSPEGEILRIDTLPATNSLKYLTDRNTSWWLSESGNLFRGINNQNWHEVIIYDKRSRIKNIALDNEGHLWISSNKGLFMLDQWISSFPTEEAVNAVLFDRQNLWYSSGSKLYKKDVRSLEDEQIFIGNNLILCLFADKYGRIWSGSFDSGLHIWDPENQRSIKITERDGLINNNVLTIDGDENAVWIGTLGGVCKFSLEDRTLTSPQNYGKEAGLDVLYIYDIHIHEDEVYLATDGGGVMKQNGNRFSRLIKDDEKQVVLDISIAADGTIWWLDSKGGLHCRTSAGKCKTMELPAGNGKPAGLETMENGDVLLFFENVLLRWNVTNSEWINYGRAYGFANWQPQLHAQSEGENNVIYTGTANSIKVLHLNHLPEKFNPKTFITSKLLFQEPVMDNNFDADENYLSFHYLGLWYTNPDQLRYKLMLEGFDHDWIISQNNNISYPQLPPGNYTFKVVAGVDGNFDESEMKSWSFSIASPWYMLWYFWLIIVLLLAILFFYFQKWREKRIRFQQQQERERVRAQYEALKSQVNPHFLFNSFNTLMALIEDDKDEATGYLTALSDFFRNILKFREVDLISLAEEIEIIKSYLLLQAKRFGKNLKLELNIPEEAYGSLIPPLTLQLLVENTFKHNVVSRLRPLELKIYIMDDYLIVWNALQEKTEKEISTGYGLDSIRKKYAYHTDREVIIERNENSFSVKLPLIFTV